MAVFLAVVAGCASAPAPPVRETLPPLSARIAADPISRPGDAEPVPREVNAWTSAACPPDADVCPMQLGVEIRNRCGRPATFVVGPEVDAPPADAPTHTLAPGEAVATEISGDHRIYLAQADGGYAKPALPRRTVVFLGEPACDRIVAE